MDKEIKIEIGDRYGNSMITYRENSIISLNTNRELFSGAPSVGNCICGELTAKLDIPSSAIPKNAKIIPYVRDAGTNVWKKKSEFYVYNRDVDEEFGTTSITAYDAIYRSEAPMLTDGDQGLWPASDQSVMMIIAERTNSTIRFGSLLAMDKNYYIRYPGIILEEGVTRPQTGDAATTMREVAAAIASMYAGNWIINNDGDWELIQLGNIPDETHYLVTRNNNPITLGGVRILV